MKESIKFANMLNPNDVMEKEKNFQFIKKKYRPGTQPC